MVKSRQMYRNQVHGRKMCKSRKGCRKWGKKMKQKKWGILFCVLLMVAFVCMFAADKIQTDGGKVVVSEGNIESEEGDERG